MSDTCTRLFPQDGDTPLHDAAYWGHLDIVKFLIQHRADPSLRNKVSVITGAIIIFQTVLTTCQNTTIFALTCTLFERTL